ncbi:ferrous iron transport protein A [Campylobacter sp. RM6883]|uniref:FeoA family protein n=1 Tax=Campylobacter californiensis TaxID=1032243 RepID=UPI001451DF49|nr:ferrous iron transport protein A [Campylobacter sp. RM6914]MBE2984099.1 ferrous iron transport protein A [Campylobacter sp. RM6883]MBE2995761.1 ferrous iron transport protein A [Campylobacter sp. RM6913]QCD51455.1 ferrous iron transport protein A [Campylobacter sp. RM6914]
MNLDEVATRQTYKIVSINANGKLMQKLLDMGFVIGAQIEVIREAPLSDPMEIKIHSYLISLRKSEAMLIKVEQCL